MAFLAACDPKQAPTSPTRASLSEGNYSLTISVGARMAGPGISSMLCISTGARPQVERVRIPMTVRAVGSAWFAEVSDLQSGTMRMSLQVSEGGAVGTLGGIGREIATNTTVTVSNRDANGAEALLTSASPFAIGGEIDGRVRFSTPTGTLSCSDHNWSLERR